MTNLSQNEILLTFGEYERRWRAAELIRELPKDVRNRPARGIQIVRLRMTLWKEARRSIRPAHLHQIFLSTYICRCFFFLRLRDYWDTILFFLARAFVSFVRAAPKGFYTFPFPMA